MARPPFRRLRLTSECGEQVALRSSDFRSSGHVYTPTGKACSVGRFQISFCREAARAPTAAAPPSPPARLQAPTLVVLGTAVLPGARQRPSWLWFAPPCGRVTLSAARCPSPARHPPLRSAQVPGPLCDGVVGVLLPPGVCSGCIWDTDPYQILDLQIFPPVPAAAFSFRRCVDGPRPAVAPLGCFCRGLWLGRAPAPGTR